MLPSRTTYYEKTINYNAVTILSVFILYYFLLFITKRRLHECRNARGMLAHFAQCMYMKKKKKKNANCLKPSLSITLYRYSHLAIEQTITVIDVDRSQRNGFAMENIEHT